MDRAQIRVACDHVDTRSCHTRSSSTGSVRFAARRRPRAHARGMPEPAPDASPCRGRQRASGWQRLSHGLYVPDRGDAATELAAWQLVLPPAGAFTHLTAAALRGWWLPPVPDDAPVFAAVPRDAGRPRRSGLRVTRHPAAPEADDLDGLRVAVPTEVLLSCAADLDVLDLVVLLDSALRSGDCTTEDVLTGAKARRRGAHRLRTALDLADPRSESACETLLRVLHVTCEIDVVPQHEVRHNGDLLARGDLWICGTRTLQEYDGSGHLEAQQYRDDRRRERRLLAHDWARPGCGAVGAARKWSRTTRIRLQRVSFLPTFRAESTSSVDHDRAARDQRTPSPVR